MTFKVGDVVELKSGSVPMTVYRLYKNTLTGEEECACVWVNRKTDIKSTACFVHAAFKLFTKPSPL